MHHKFSLYNRLLQNLKYLYLLYKKITLQNFDTHFSDEDLNLYKNLHDIKKFIPTYLPDIYVRKGLHDADMVYKNYIKDSIYNVGDISRFFQFILNIKLIEKQNIEGDFAEVGVYKGATASILSYFGKLFHRKVYLFDTFEGFHDSDLLGIDSNKLRRQFNDVKMQDIIEKLDMDTCKIIKGFFPDSINSECKNTRYSFVHLDCDLYSPTKAGLEFFWERLNEGGFIFIHDYFTGYWEGVTKAVNEFIY